jgi:hypothetical protein
MITVGRWEWEVCDTPCRGDMFAALEMLCNGMRARYGLPPFSDERAMPWPR